MTEVKHAIKAERKLNIPDGSREPILQYLRRAASTLENGSERDQVSLTCNIGNTMTDG